MTCLTRAALAPLCALAVLTALPAAALTVADCTTHQGCTCAETPLSPEEASLVMGIDTPANAAAMILVVQDGTGIWSPLSAEDIDITAGGDGSCAGPLVPEDGVWTTQSTLNTLSCGPGTAMMRQMIEGNLNREKPVRVTWGGRFDGDRWRDAWLAANPDPEATRPAWTRVSEVELTGADRLPGMTSSYRMVLLTPRSFRMDWDMQAVNDAGPCTWSVTNRVRKTAD